MGAHVSIIAPTDGGKTYLIKNGLLPVLDSVERVLYIDVKGDDPELKSFGYRVQRFPNPAWQRWYHSKEGPDWYRLAVPGELGGMSRQSQALLIYDALRRAYKQGEWTIAVDEARSLLRLGLQPALEDLWEKGRTRKITFISGTQAPRYMPGLFYDQPKLLAIGRTMDQRARVRLREIGANSKVIESVIGGLRKHEFLWIGEGGDYMVITKVGRG